MKKNFFLSNCECDFESALYCFICYKFHLNVEIMATLERHRSSNPFEELDFPDAPTHLPTRVVSPTNPFEEPSFEEDSEMKIPEPVTNHVSNISTPIQESNRPPPDLSILRSQPNNSSLSSMPPSYDTMHHYPSSLDTPSSLLPSHEDSKMKDEEKEVEEDEMDLPTAVPISFLEGGEENHDVLASSTLLPPPSSDFLFRPTQDGISSYVPVAEPVLNIDQMDIPPPLIQSRQQSEELKMNEEEKVPDRSSRSLLFDFPISFSRSWSFRIE